jgi:hypothetical protein
MQNAARSIFPPRPAPHLYLMDSVGSTDNWSLLAKRPEWALKLRVLDHPSELNPEETLRQLNDTARLGTRAIWLGHNITAANAQWVIARARQMGLATYGEFIATPYRRSASRPVWMRCRTWAATNWASFRKNSSGRWRMPPEGPAAATAYDYAERLPPTHLQLREYAHFLASHHAALMPTFSISYSLLPEHRNLWKEPAAALLDPARVYEPVNRATGEIDYPLAPWTRRLPGMGQRYVEEGLRKKAGQSALRLWRLNETLFAAYPHYLAASGAPVRGALPGIGMHTELELLVRLGFSPREALAAATNNYSLQFGWNELGLIAPGRRADILVVDGDPTANIWNARRISTLIIDGNLDRSRTASASRR